MAAREIFTSTTIWVCPSGVTSVDVECYGAGGSGGISDNAGTNGSSGGGGGAYSKITAFATTPGNSYTITVGVGGVAVVSQNSAGNDGGDSWFSTSGTVLAKGGKGGLQGIGTGLGAAFGGDKAAGIGTTKHSGGNSGTTNGTVGCGGGSSAGTAADGNNGGFNDAAPEGTGGTAPAGGFAGGTSANNSTPGAPSAPGGGGGSIHAASASRTQIKGADGQVQLSYVKSDTFTQLDTSISVDAVISTATYNVTKADVSVSNDLGTTVKYGWGDQLKSSPATFVNTPKS